ncbi:UPF0481 protein At3g47200-like [Aristolochia californica]|uniref:UPF0481 protein At3g47200-like n=1 Tax=Aristolochia californica TaxID=171875 RepID=UPI0035D7AAE5
MEMETERLLKQAEITVEADHLADKCYVHVTAEEKQISTPNKEDVILDMDLLEKLKNLSSEEEAKQWENCCIYRVPSNMREANPEAYTPKLVSFGPYHHGAPHLMEMEKHKHRALAHVLKRSRTSVADYLKALQPVTKRLMESYRDLDKKWKDQDKFLQLMVLDGMFWLEIIDVHIIKTQPAELGYCDSDPVFSSSAGPFTLIDLRNDLSLLENQLPYSLITMLSLVLKKRTLPRKQEKRQVGKIKEAEKEAQEGTEITAAEKEKDIMGLHYLDWLRKLKIGHHREGTQKLSNTFYPASILREAGIVFSKKSESNSDLDITFDKENGILSLPEILVNQARGIELLNMVAFELLHPGEGHEIRSFILFISFLAKSPKDVRLLQSEGIISSNLPDEEKIAGFLHRLRNNTKCELETSYEDLRSEMHEYRKRNMMKWKRRFRDWRINLKETYFKSPWSIISVFAGAVLLNLTTLGTVYTVLSYYKSGP